MREIRIRLNKESVNEAIKQVEQYKEYIIRATRELGQALVEDGVQICRMKIIGYDAIETGNLLGSVEGFFDPISGKGIISCNAYSWNGMNYAALVEYGTGIVGAQNSSVEPKPSGYQHDVHNHGDQGWFYANGRWTKGMPPRPFMWDTWVELCNKTNEMVREKFNG